jgi:hypothetical protein
MESTNNEMAQMGKIKQTNVKFSSKKKKKANECKVSTKTGDPSKILEE